MNDRYKTKDKLIRDLQQLRQENKSFKALLDSGQRESASPEVSAIEAIVAMVIQGKSDKLAWWQADISTGKLHCDQHKMERWGCPPEKFNSLTDFASLIHPEDFDPVKRAVDEFVTGTVDQLELEYRVRAHSGEYLWLSMSGSVVNYDGDGKPLICAGFVYNITEHKQVQEGLFKKEQMLQALMDNFPGVIFWKDRDSRYLGCNQALATRAGLDNPGQIVGKTDDQLPWGPKEAEKFRAEDLKVFESGQALLHMDEPQPHQGQEAWFDKSKFPIRDTHGQVIALLGIGHDVSRLKVTEQELIDANQQLTLQNKQKAKQAAALKKALEKAEESDRLKSEFLTNMSHEIRTPMNSILGFTELLKDIDLSHEKQQAFLEIIEKSVARMLHIISDIVEFSSIESGQMKVYLSETNVNQEIENIYAFFIPEAEYKGIRLFTRKTLPTSQASIQTDRDKFYAIMSNLMNNAIKFTQSGSIEIGYVKTDDYWEFYVKDTGIGVTETQKEFIFNRFRQGSESENKKYEGAGLGLSISKAYVEALGGRIWVESHPESKYYKGSAFYFTLPSMAGNENQPRGRRLSELR